MTTNNARLQEVSESYDVVVIGGGPSGATAAYDLATDGHKVLLLDRAGRIKPCGGAVPPRLIKDFDIPNHLIAARARSARITSPASRQVDMPIDGGYVGMVDRGEFDEWLRVRAADRGVTRKTAKFTKLQTDNSPLATVEYEDQDGAHKISARYVVGADGANSKVAKMALPNSPEVPMVYAFHEVIEAPKNETAAFKEDRCEVYYQGKISPDFYGWVFPHGDQVSVGSGSAIKGFSLRKSVDDLRAATGLVDQPLIRREGAPIPMKPRKTWDNGKNIVVIGDAAGVVAPSSGEGIYYAMASGRIAAEEIHNGLVHQNAKCLKNIRKRFMRQHGMVFRILSIMQHFWYCSDKRRERFVSMCADPDVQRLTWEAYMNKRLVRAKPSAHIRIFFKDLGHLLGVSQT